jgi:hypothetical protein
MFFKCSLTIKSRGIKMNHAKMTKQSGTSRVVAQKEWALINCEATDCTMDNSGHYTVINYAGQGFVRCDIMTDKDLPVMSFKGFFKDVRKCVMQFFADEKIGISTEHASYIGEEIALANTLAELYVQD